MTLLTFKWLTAVIIFVISLIAGFISIRFAYKHQRSLQIGDAAANGIFIGAALFHLFPGAVEEFHVLKMGDSAYLYSIMIILASFFFLTGIDQLIKKISSSENAMIGIGLLTITLSIHALIAGVALGLSETFEIGMIIFIAILAHKCFEMFAFIMVLHRQLQKHRNITIIFLLFSFITPIGIWLGIMSHVLIEAKWDNLLAACFNAFAAGTFLYIGLIDRHHAHYYPVPDSYHQYTRFLAAIGGVIVMGILGLVV